VFARMNQIRVDAVLCVGVYGLAWTTLRPE
jgi:hypothetical protein